MKPKLPLCILGLIFTLCAHSQSVRGEVEKQVHREMYNKYGKDGEDKLNNWMGNMFSGKTADAYKFNTYIKQHITIYDNGKPKQESDMLLYTGTAKATGMRYEDGKKKKDQEQLIMIMDMDNNSLVTLNETKKEYSAMSMDAMKNMAAKRNPSAPSNPNASTPETDCKKTGKTKTIMGYTCTETLCVDERGGKISIWSTSGFKYAMPPNAMGKAAMSMGGLMGGISGAVLGYTTYDKKGEIASTMEVVEINKSANLEFNMADFKRSETPNFNFSPY